MAVTVEPTLLIALAATCALAAAVHSALGFGSGPLLGPVALQAFEPGTAVAFAVLVGLAVNGLQLSTERGSGSQVPYRRLAPLWVGALPGCVAGAMLAGEIAPTALALAVAAMLVISAATLFFSPSAVLGLSPFALAVAGLFTGASAALTGIFGPLLGVVLVAIGQRGGALRDGLGASFLLIGAAAVTASLVLEPQWTSATAFAALLPAAVAGYLVGRRGARRLGPVLQRRAVLIAVLAGALLALAQATA